MGAGDLNTLAAWLYSMAGVIGRPAPLSMAQTLGLTLIALPVGGGATLIADAIVWDPTVSLARQRAMVLRELCRWVVRKHGLSSTDSQLAVDLAVAFNAYALRRLNVRPLAAASPDASDRRPLAKISLDADRHPALRTGTIRAVPRQR